MSSERKQPWKYLQPTLERRKALENTLSRISPSVFIMVLASTSWVLTKLLESTLVPSWRILSCERQCWGSPEHNVYTRINIIDIVNIIDKVNIVLIISTLKEEKEEGRAE